MKLSIIIVSYNVRSYLRQCLNSLYRTNNIQNIEVIVVDNYSHDKTCDMIIDEYPQVKLIQNFENLGFSKAVNIGLDNVNGEYLCILNPDTLVSGNTFKRLITYIENHPKVGCIGPKILNADGTFQLSSKRSFPYIMASLFKLTGLSYVFPKSSLFGQYNLTYLDENKIQRVDALSGSFMLFSRKVFQLVGKFDESFFMYGEDLDYCYRIQQEGYELVYNPDVSIIHYKGESVKSAPFDKVNMFYSAINIFYLKHSANFPSWRFIKPIVSLGIYLRKLSAYLINYSTRIIACFFDLFSLLLCFIISFFIWFTYYHGEIVVIENILIHWQLVLNIVISWAISSYLFNLYNRDYLSYGRSIVTAIMTFLLSATSTYFIGIFAYSRVVLLLTIISATILTSFWRLFIHLLYRYRKIKISETTPLFSRRAVIVGTGAESMRIGSLLNNAPGYHFILVGYIDNNNNSNTDKFIGRLEYIRGLIQNHHINEIIIPERWGTIRRLIDLIHDLRDLNINCKLVPEGEKTLIGKGMVENLSGVPLIDIEFPLFEKFQQITKRIFDTLLSSGLIIITFPFHLYYLLLNKISRRVVWSNESRHINVYNYQSNSKIIQDLPLLLLIFKGEMSFVGSQLIDIFHNDPRLMIKPGLTGLVHLRSKDIQSDFIRDHEQYYVMNYSIILDIEIIIKSIIKI